MKILLDRLSESPTHYRFDAEPAWWRQAQAVLPEPPHASPNSFQFFFSAHLNGSDVYLHRPIGSELAV